MIFQEHIATADKLMLRVLLLATCFPSTDSSFKSGTSRGRHSPLRCPHKRHTAHALEVPFAPTANNVA